MPGSHGEITVDEQNRVVNNKNTRKKKKKKTKEDDVKEEVGISDGSENGNQLVKPRKGYINRIRKKLKSPKRSSSSSRSGSCKGGCFSMMRRHGTEEKEEGSLSSSPPSDPNDECFTHGMMRVMLETNDFFSDECNPHR